MTFENKVVVITGATGALGSVIVETFLHHNATVIAVARHVEKIGTAADSSRQLHRFSADVTTEKDVAACFANIDATHGGADILIHSVGGFWGGKNLQQTDADKWDSMMSLNLRSAFLCSKYALPQMQKKGGGTIITIAAMAALEPKANRAAYLTSKAGLLALTHAIAEEGKTINVQANALAPSIILTEANKSAMPDMDASKWIKPEDMAETILFLCSENAGAITGTTIKML